MQFKATAVRTIICFPQPVSAAGQAKTALISANSWACEIAAAASAMPH